ncbi:2,3-diphosphoglycerate-dependent phosphoglycerate mutase [uncultured Ezakiella sp.]|uniref:2,3-diphosphoglycerate-dependent phosphoglycerate mutase n=1 Tax=uncultured Ezakiella sp. TaxID=1637529 RepID=UPI0025D8B629|nr:2,3-diphosphoglycerate-dependent phosphoglycerate mutase [uncultured Ezakiella sp.]
MKLVLVRHGQSEWNLENKFTGWVDVDLSEKGYAEAKHAGQILKDHGLEFDKAYTSVLKRAIKTLNIILEETDQLWLPTVKSWRLNERHYGALQGLNKAETAEKYGDEKVHIWRRSYDTLPPLMNENDELSQINDRRYLKDVVPMAENLKITLERVMPIWQDQIEPDLRAGKNIIIAAHGNSLRALTKHLEGISDEDIMGLEIPTGSPIIYELDHDLKVVDKKTFK